jgi:hypothetical protein
MDRYRNVCVWFMARSCRFPKVGSHGCQRGNHRLPLQRTAGSQGLELLVPNLGTMGYHCKELPVPRGLNSWFPTWEPWVTTARNCRLPEVGTHTSQSGNHRLPLQATASSQMLELMLPNMGTKVTMTRNCQFPDLETYGCQPGNQRLPLQGIACSKKLEFLFSKLRGNHFKNCGFPKFETHVTNGRIC